MARLGTALQPCLSGALGARSARKSGLGGVVLPAQREVHKGADNTKPAILKRLTGFKNWRDGRDSNSLKVLEQGDLRFKWVDSDGLEWTAITLILTGVGGVFWARK